MTREEAIDVLQEKHDECKAFYDLAAHPEEAYPGTKEYMEALQMALAVLRAPTREQVRAIKSEWEKVDHLEYGELAFDTLRCGECEYEENIDPEEKHPNFCPNCGSPMTKKGVLILCNRLEVLKGETKAD